MSSRQSILNRLRAFAAEHGIRRAWFTTFVVDVSFFERHLLPILLVADVPVGAHDLESLNEQMIEDEAPVDIRVFHDFRGAYQTGRPKQTTFSMHPVHPKDVDRSCSHGVFHPKLAWFETNAGEWFVLAGSANLTYGGYARNRESVVLTRVETQEQADAIRSFFRRFHPDELPGSPPIPQSPTHARWRLQYTGMTESFEDAMAWASSGLAWMVVWSPYFSEGMVESIHSRMGSIQELCLVPDLSHEGKIRLDAGSVQELQAMPRVKFCQSGQHEEQDHALTHAKMWLSPRSLAVGSWNFTESALGWAPSSRNNVEGGLIFSLSESEANQLRNSAKLVPRAPEVSEKPDDLEDEELQGLPNYTLVAEIQLDWSTRRLKLTQFVWHRSHAEPPEVDFELPTGERVSRARLEAGLPLGTSNRALALNRQFHVYSGDELQFSGYILEIGLALRPTRRFENLNHMFQAWLTRDPGGRTDLARPISSPKHMDAVTGEWLSELSGNGHHEWFSTFLALEYIQQQVDGLKRESRLDCLRLGYQQPGSVVELREMVASELPDGVYAWLVTTKTNDIIATFNEKVEAEDQIEQIEVPELSLPGDISPEKWRDWLAEIEQLISP